MIAIPPLVGLLDKEGIVLFPNSTGLADAWWSIDPFIGEVSIQGLVIGGMKLVCVNSLLDLEIVSEVELTALYKGFRSIPEAGFIECLGIALDILPGLRSWTPLDWALNSSLRLSAIVVGSSWIDALGGVSLWEPLIELCI